MAACDKWRWRIEDWTTSHFFGNQRRLTCLPALLTVTTGLVELASFWTLFGPYAPDRWGPRGNGPMQQINDLGRRKPLGTTCK